MRFVRKNLRLPTTLLMALLALPFLAIPSVPGAAAALSTSGGTVNLSLHTCPQGTFAWEEADTCTEIVEDDGSAVVTTADGTERALVEFPRNDDGSYAIESPAGLVTVSGLAPVSMPYKVTDGNMEDDDSATWLIGDGMTIDGDVFYYDVHKSMPLPLSKPGRERGQINLHLLLCENGVPNAGAGDCTATEDDGRGFVNTGTDADQPLRGFDRNDDGSYAIATNDSVITVSSGSLDSDNGWDTHMDADNESMTGSEFFVIEGQTRDVYVYYTPSATGAGTPAASPAASGTAPSTV